MLSIENIFTTKNLLEDELWPIYGVGEIVIFGFGIAITFINFQYIPLIIKIHISNIYHLEFQHSS